MAEGSRSFLLPYDVPEGWRVAPLSQVLRERRIRVSDEKFPPLSVTMDGIVPQRDHVALTGDGSNRKGVRKGDLVINSRSDRKGAAGIAPRDGSVSPISIVMKPVEIEPRFLHHLVRCSAFQEEFYRRGQGIVADLWTTRFPALKRIEIAIPPRRAQVHIADFLDRETAHIDALIKKKERLIELLAEKRATLITHAVTKGLNPDAPMKDSGVEWLRAIPAHWEITALGGVAEPGPAGFTDGDWIESPFITDEGIRLVQTGNIGVGEYREQGYRFISEESFHHLGCTEVFPGDVLISRLAAPVGRSCRAPSLGVRMIASVDVAILRPAPNINPDYLVFSMSSNSYLEWLTAEERGGTRGRVSRSRLGRVRMPIPPLSEQNAIVDMLSDEVDRMKSVTRLTERSISLLRERRAALITATVTGQLDISENPS